MRPERFELPTYCSGGNRSIHLSYGRPRVGLVYMGDLRSINADSGLRTKNHAGSRSDANWFRSDPAGVSSTASPTVARTVAARPPELLFRKLFRTCFRTLLRILLRNFEWLVAASSTAATATASAVTAAIATPASAVASAASGVFGLGACLVHVERASAHLGAI